MLDIIIIGAGVSGAACARELSRYDAKILVLEKEEDVCCGTSKANSAIVHGGFDARTGTLMAKLNVRGSEVMEQLSKDLDFHYNRCGSLVLCMAEEDRPKLRQLYEKGVANGVKELRIIEREELLQMEPNVSDDAVAALWAPSGAIVCPFGLNLALAENAAANGAGFVFNAEVTGLEQVEGGWLVQTSQGDFLSRVVINAAGVHAGEIHNLVSDEKMTITNRRGDYYLLDKTAKCVSHTVFTLPNRMGKGVLVSPTVHGNTIVGPTAIDIPDPENTATTAAGLQQAGEKASYMIKNLPLRQVITSFAGLRAHLPEHDFIIGEVEGAPGFVDVAGIESPGLSASPAIGEYVADLVKDMLNLTEKEGFTPTRKGILNPAGMTIEERNALIKENPAYGTVICRCETVTEGEIIDAIRRVPGAKSIDGVKRRTRAGMGRCQGGFCSPRVLEILSRELGVPMGEITKSGGNSRLIVGVNKDNV
mgnify:FL=1